MNSKLIQLSDYSKLLYNFTKCGDLLVIGVAVVECTENTTLSKDLVSKSFQYLCNRHPLLNATLHEDKTLKTVYFCLNENEKFIDYDKYLKWDTFATRREFEIKLEEFNNKRIDYEANEKLWRACVYNFMENNRQKYAIAFLLPLFMTDALNITSLSIEIVNIINALMNNTECEEMKVKLEVVDNYFNMIKLTDQQEDKIDELVKREYNGFKFDCNLRSDETGSKIRIFEIDEETTSRLIRASKLNKTRLTGVLSAATFYALKELYSEKGIEMQKQVCWGISTNIRFRLSPPVDYSDIGSFTTFFLAETEPSKFGDYKDIWKDSRYFDELIHEYTSLESGAILYDSYDFESTNYTNNLFENLSIEETCKELSSGSQFDVCISNIGTYLVNSKKYNNCDTNRIRIKEIYYADSLNSNPPIDSGLLIHVSYWDNKLYFMISSNKASISSENVDRFIELYQDCINNKLN